MATVKFEDYKQRILDAVNAREASLGINEPVSLFEGFVNQPFQTEFSGSFVIGGPTVPMIMLIGKNSGRIYHFALKALIPDIAI